MPSSAPVTCASAAATASWPRSGSPAKRSELQVIGREPDAARADASRRALDAAGLYGPRVSIHHGPLDELPYSDYLFNVVVAVGAGASRTEVLRVLRPCGGVAFPAGP